jgi:hypothetical protein
VYKNLFQPEAGLPSSEPRPLIIIEMKQKPLSARVARFYFVQHSKMGKNIPK